MTLFLQANVAGAANGFSNAVLSSGNTKARLTGAGVYAGFFTTVEDNVENNSDSTSNIIFRQSPKHCSLNVLAGKAHKETGEIEETKVSTELVVEEDEAPKTTKIMARKAKTQKIKANNTGEKNNTAAALPVSKKEKHENLKTVVYSPKKTTVKVVSIQDEAPDIVREIPEVNEKNSLIARFLSGKNDKNEKDDKDILLPDAIVSETIINEASVSSNIELRLIELTEKIDVMAAQIAILTKAAGDVAVAQGGSSVNGNAESYLQRDI